MGETEVKEEEEEQTGFYAYLVLEEGKEGRSSGMLVR